MKYVNPIDGSLSELYDGVTYTASYYKPATTLTGVVDEAYTAWDGVTAFNVGDYCILPTLKKIYRSTIATNTSYPPANPTSWTDYGVVNSYAMFASDENIGSKTNGANSVMTFNFSKCDTIGFVNTNFVTMTLELLDSLGTVVDTRVINGYDIGCLSFSDYYYTDKKIKTRAIVSNFEWLPTSTLRVTITGAFSIGTIVYGKVEDLGVALWGTKMDFSSSSKFKTNEFTGFRDVIRYGNFRTLDVQVLFDTPDFDVLSQKVASIIDKNILWIPTDSDKFTELISIGYLENFSIPLENAVKIQTNSTIVGVHT